MSLLLDCGMRWWRVTFSPEGRPTAVELETLLEVRAWWKQAAHTLDFAQRLASEIQAAGGTGTVALPSYQSGLLNGQPRRPQNDSDGERAPRPGCAERGVA